MRIGEKRLCDKKFVFHSIKYWLLTTSLKEEKSIVLQVIWDFFDLQKKACKFNDFNKYNLNTEELLKNKKESTPSSLICKKITKFEKRPLKKVKI